MKSQEPKDKKFRQLSEEELENVNGGGAGCFTDDKAVCIKRGGIYDRLTCQCSVSVFP